MVSKPQAAEPTGARPLRSPSPGFFAPFNAGPYSYIVIHSYGFVPNACLYGYDLYSYGSVPNVGLNSYGLYSYGFVPNAGLYSYGLYSDGAGHDGSLGHADLLLRFLARDPPC